MDSPVDWIIVGTIAVVAFLVMRWRDRRIRIYEPPAYVPGGWRERLPRSAITSSDQQERRRFLVPFWWLLLLIAHVALASWVAELVKNPEGHALAEGYAVVVLALAALLFWPFFLWTQRIQARNARLAAEHPQALVLTASIGLGDRGLRGRGLAEASGQTYLPRSHRLGVTESLVIDDRGIALWRGGARPLQQFFFPWEQIGPIEPVYVPTGNAGLMLGIQMLLRGPQRRETAEWTAFIFQANRTNAAAAFAYFTKQPVTAFAFAVEDRRPIRPGHTRGLIPAEWRDYNADAPTTPTRDA